MITKRKLFGMLVIVVFIATAAFITSLKNGHARAPHFVAGAPASIPTLKFVDYDWLADAPFENDRLWCWALTSTGIHTYLYDLKKREVLGELFDGAATGIGTRDGSRLLVRGAGSGPSFKQEVSDILGKLVGRKMSGPRERAEVYWIFDTSRNVATKIGQFSQLQGGGSVWHSSPDFRRGYTMPTSTSGTSLFVCDLDNVSMTQFELKGYPKGWWDDHHILLENRLEKFELFDIQTETVIPLFSRNQIQATVARVGVATAPDLSAQATWNGTNYDFYFGLADHVRGLHGNSFLLRANRSGPSLSLSTTNFGFRWGGSFNATADLYLFQGEKGVPGSGGNGAVYVRNLTNGMESMIVPPDNKGQYAIPRFYGNEVIYFRDRVLHRIGVDGSNDTLLLTNSAN
jgi:hypothetical protein